MGPIVVSKTCNSVLLNDIVSNKLTVLSGTCIQHLLDFDECDNGSQSENFAGEFLSYFALHDKKTLADLQKRWGSFIFMDGGLTVFVKDKDPEHLGMYSMYHPMNAGKTQLAFTWQPLDEIRDYFGESFIPQAHPSLNYLRCTCHILYNVGYLLVHVWVGLSD